MTAPNADESTPRKNTLTKRILIAMGTGIVLGLVLNFLFGVRSPQESARLALMAAGQVEDVSEVAREEIRAARTLVRTSLDDEIARESLAEAEALLAGLPDLPEEAAAEIEKARDSIAEALAKDDRGNFVTPWLQDGVLELLGRLFLSALKLIVVPIVFVSLVCGVASLTDLKQLGRISVKTLALYLGTTAVAITLAITFALLVQPGSGLTLETEADFAPPPAKPLIEVLIDIFPTNPVEALAEGNVLQIIVFAILFGIAMTLCGDVGARLRKGFEDLNEVILKLVMIIINLAPYGVFALLAKTFSEQGLSAIVPLGKYFGLVLLVLVVHGLVTYPTLLTVLGRVNPMTFLRKIREVQIFAFSTSSSNATIPVTLEVVQQKLGVKRSISSFTVPLGATINMDGTAIMQGCATVFIAQAYGVPLGLPEYLMVILTATLASIGTAGVPSVGLVMLALVLEQVGLPVEGIGLILGIDRFLDMVRTAVNVTGDAAVSTIVAKSEGQLDEAQYNR